MSVDTKQKHHAYYITNREKILARQKQYTTDNDRSNYMTNYRLNNKLVISENRKKYYRKNKVARIKYGITYKRTKYNSDPRFALLGKLRSRIYSALKNGPAVRKTNKTLELLGCSIPTLMIHLESKFQNGMSWSNFGEWHIDHIIPCSKYDLTSIQQQHECFNYNNLQPLWATDNIKKGNKT